MKKIGFGLVFLAFCLFFTGCYSVPAGLAASSTPINPGSYKVLGHATGTSSYVSFFGGLPFGHPDYDRAIANAVKKFNGTALINVRSYSTVIYLYIISLNQLTVEGDVVGQATN